MCVVHVASDVATVVKGAKCIEKDLGYNIVPFLLHYSSRLNVTDVVSK